MKDNKNKILYFDVSNNCTSEAINASLLNLLNIENKIKKILSTFPYYSNIKIFKNPISGSKFKFLNKINIENNKINNIYIFLKQFLLNIKQNGLSLNIQISVLRILTNFFKIIENDLLFSIKIKRYFFNTINEIAYNTLIFAYMINYINPIEINCSSIPIPLLINDIIKKNWILTASINMSTTLLAQKIIPCDPLGIIFMKSLVTQNNYTNHYTLKKIGKGSNLNSYNTNNISRSLLYKINSSNNSYNHKIKNKNIFQINAIINTNYIKLTELFNSLEKIGLNNFFSIPIYTFNKKHSHYIYIYIHEYLLKEVTKNIFMHAKCDKIYITTIECHKIISNIINIPINIGSKNSTYQIKEYIFNNNIITISPILEDLKKTIGNNYINLKIISAKMILLWKKLRYK